jgi:hypothetical protein
VSKSPQIKSIMETRKLIPVEQLQYSPIIMGEIYRKMSYIPLEKSKIGYGNKSETIYFVLNQTQWKENDCTLFLNMSDGREHNRLEMEQTFRMNLECWRFQLEAYYRKNEEGNAELVVKANQIIIQRVSDMDIEFSHSANESEYIEMIKAEEQTIINANKLIN